MKDIHGSPITIAILSAMLIRVGLFPSISRALIKGLGLKIASKIKPPSKIIRPGMEGWSKTMPIT